MINKDKRRRRDTSIYKEKGEHGHIYVHLTAVKMYTTKEEKEEH